MMLRYPLLFAFETRAGCLGSRLSEKCLYRQGARMSWSALSKGKGMLLRSRVDGERHKAAFTLQAGDRPERVIS